MRPANCDWTVPRMELIAASLAARVFNIISQELPLKFSRKNFWIASSATLCLIHNTSRRVSVFVDGCLSEIRNLTPVSSWRFCPGNLNPADVGTRQVSFKKLDKFLKRVEGPEFLRKPESEWPCPPETDSSPEFSACLIKSRKRGQTGS